MPTLFSFSSLQCIKKPLPARRLLPLFPDREAIINQWKENGITYLSEVTKKGMDGI